MKLNYYWAIFERGKKSTTTLQVCDCQSHPFIWIRNQQQLYDRHWICLNWKEISKEEYEYYKATIYGEY